MSGSRRAHERLKANMKKVDHQNERKVKRRADIEPTPKAANDSAIQPIPERDSHRLIIVATLDGHVMIRTPGGDSKLDPDTADICIDNMREAARVARHVRALAATAPKGLDEQGMIDFMTQAFSKIAMAPETKDGHS